MSIRNSFLVLAQLVSATLAVAQQSPPAPAPDSGARVRVTYSEGGKSRRLTGRLTFQDTDSLTLLVTTATSAKQVFPPGYNGVAPQRLSTGMASIPRSAISLMELSGGRRSNAGRGVIIGGGIGTVAGLGIGIAMLCSVNGDSFVCIDQTSEVVGITVILGLGGAMIGGLIGATSHHETWRPIDRQPAVTPVIGRMGGATTVGLALRF